MASWSWGTGLVLALGAGLQGASAFTAPSHLVRPQVPAVDLNRPPSAQRACPLWSNNAPACGSAGARRRHGAAGQLLKGAATAVAVPEGVAPYKPGEVKPGDYLEGMNRFAWRTLPEIFETMATLTPQEVAVTDPIHKPQATLTYAELNDNISKLAAGLQAKGLGEGECVSIFSENSHRWLIADQAVLRAGACNAVRGVRAPIEELQYIYSNSDSVACVVETPDLLKPLLESGGGLSFKIGPPKFLLVLFPGEKSGQEIQQELGTGVPVVTFDELVALDAPLRAVTRDNNGVATLVYTSGTTNKPKGVLLRHSNLLHQVNHNTFSDNQEARFNPRVGDTLVSVLPCWHIFERTAEYWMFSKGIRVVYSSVKSFKKDLSKYRPEFLVAVPRLFETIYRGVQQKFGAEKGVKKALIAFFTAVSMAHVRATRVFRGLVIADKPPSFLTKLAAGLIAVLLAPLRAAGDKLVWSKVRDGLGGKVKVMVSGGSSMPLVLEDFFEMIKATVIVGYGMTETSPVINNRVAEANLAGSVGWPAANTEVKIVHTETGERLPTGQSGIVMMKGPQMMTGYKANPEATSAAFDSEGFLNTGDLGRLNPGTKHLIITGRAKDTIVLSNGENIEPQPIEDVVCAKSDLVDQMMCVGQDKRQICAMVVPNVKALASRGLMSYADAEAVAEIHGSQVLTNGIAGDGEQLKEIEERLNANKRARKAVLADIRALQGADFKDFERVADVYLLLEPLNMANGLLTQTLKIKRNIVADVYAEKIASLYASSR